MRAPFARRDSATARRDSGFRKVRNNVRFFTGRVGGRNLSFSLSRLRGWIRLVVACPFPVSTFGFVYRRSRSSVKRSRTDASELRPIRNCRAVPDRDPLPRRDSYESSETTSCGSRRVSGETPRRLKMFLARSIACRVSQGDPAKPAWYARLL